MTDTGSRIIAALEAAWEDIRQRHPDVPPVILITGTARTHRIGEAKVGHFGADRWNTKGGRVPELFLAGELLTPAGDFDEESAGRRTLTTLLHEAAHGAAHTRKIKDCSRQGRYHNKRFAAIAAELGLTPPVTPHPSIGFSGATLDDEGAAQWSSTIEAIDAAALPHLDNFMAGATATPTPTTPTGTEGDDAAKAGRRFSVICSCLPPRRLSITPRQYGEAPLICGRCEEVFQRA